MRMQFIMILEMNFFTLNDHVFPSVKRLWGNFARTGDIEHDCNPDPDDDGSCQYGAAVCVRQVDNEISLFFGSPLNRVVYVCMGVVSDILNDIVSTSFKII